MVKLNQDFKEFLKSLNDHEVRYLLVGGYAVGFHGYPRYTRDLDFWVEAEALNAERLIEALNDFGFSKVGLTAHDFIQANNVIQLGYPPNRIDLITSLTGLVFSECYSKRAVAVLDGVKTTILDLESLKLNKRSIGRHQDLADLERLEE